MNATFPLEDILYDVNGNPLDFKGSRMVKRGHAKLNLTKEHIEEYIRCKEDICYFAERYYYIIDPDEGLAIITLYDYQRVMLKNFVDNRFNIVLSSRQSGKSTIAGIFLLWLMTFHADKAIGVLANKEKTSIEIFLRIRTAYEYLPNYIKCGVIDFSKTSLGFDNGSRCIASSTSSTAIRGYALNCVTLDSKITIRNKNTHKIESLTILDLLKRQLHLSKIININIDEDNEEESYWLYLHDNKSNK